MESTLVYTALTVLSLSIALNLKLTFSLYKKIQHLDLVDNPIFTTAVGEKLPEFKAKTLLHKEWFQLEDNKQPTVLIFLSSKCPICKDKIPEIEALLPLLSQAGLLMNFVSYESKGSMVKFLAGSALADITLLANKKNYKQLNPSISTPFYLFVDHLGQLTAGGTIGDDDWLSFMSQMEEINTSSGEAA